MALERPTLKTKEDYDRYYSVGGFPYAKESTRKFLMDVVKIHELPNTFNQKLTLLDLGCGNGFLSDIFAEWFDVIGIDQSTVGIEKARLKVPTAKFIEGNVLEHNEKYDIVYNRACCIANYPTSSDQFKANLKHCVSLANKVFYFSEWSRADMFNTYDGRWHYKNPDEVLQEMKKYGNATMLYDSSICNYVGRIDLWK